jgi:hypothetical protein
MARERCTRILLSSMRPRKAPGRLRGSFRVILDRALSEHGERRARAPAAATAGLVGRAFHPPDRAVSDVSAPDPAYS